jgi:CheY-like chemotaxis protein
MLAMKRILIIEDDKSHLRMLNILLKKAKYEVVLSSNGLEGFELFQQEPCDLVITDIFMPEQEGLETITIFKEKYPDVKIIAISGGGIKTNYIAKDILEIASDLGATKVISKPIDIPDFLESVKELLAE